MTTNTAADDDESDGLAAIQASVAAGFAFHHVRDENGEPVATYAERWKDGAVDVYVVASAGDGWAARYRAEDYRSRIEPDPLWHQAGTAAEVIRALLELPPHGTPGAPVRAYRASGELWVPPRR